MKKVTLTISLAAAVLLAGSTVSFAGDDWQHDDDSHYKDLYELKQLHVAFHQAVSHAGVDAATKAQHLAEVLALWTDDGVLIAGGCHVQRQRHTRLRSADLMRFFCESCRLLRVGSRLGLADPDLYRGHHPI